MKRPYCIAFDIGGTQLRAGIVLPRGRLLGSPLRLDAPTVWNRPRASIGHVQTELVESIVRIAQQLRRAHPRLVLRDVGISMAGSITAKGVVRHSSGLWGSRGHDFPLAHELQRRASLRWRVVNDMTASATYYGSRPAFQRFRWIAVITVSSGVGGKVFDTKHQDVLLDPAGISGEIGHVRRILEKLREIESNSPHCGDFVTQMRGIVNAFDLKRYAAALEAIRDSQIRNNHA